MCRATVEELLAVVGRAASRVPRRSTWRAFWTLAATSARQTASARPGIGRRLVLGPPQQDVARGRPLHAGLKPAGEVEEDDRTSVGRHNGAATPC